MVAVNVGAELGEPYRRFGHGCGVELLRWSVELR